MPTFAYTGMNAEGKNLKGAIEAATSEEAVARLRNDGVILTDIKETRHGTAAQSVSMEELVVFSRQLASLVSAGIPLVRSLVILCEQVERPVFKNVIQSVQKSIEAGNSLADSFSRYPRIFSPLFVNMVYVGEFSGNLDGMLDRLASYLQSSHELSKKIKAAMIYPTGIIIVSILVLAVIFLFVIPGFKSIFTSMGGNLPLPTQILIQTSDIVKKYFLLIALGIGALIFVLKRFASTETGGELFEKLQLRAPVFGKFTQKIIMARFSKTLAILVRSGVPILNALTIAGRTTGSRIMERLLEDIKDRVARGQKLADCMRESGFFPSMVVSMVGVGEEGGDLAAMLEKIAAIYDAEVESAVAGLLSMLEPMIVVFLGVVIGGIAIALFLPIIKMSQMMTH